MGQNGIDGWALHVAETLTRKMRTLSSMWLSSIRMLQDGQDPRLFYHEERLRYLELRSALGWKKNLVVYDIGAHAGTFATFAARLRSVSTVYCFEPVASAFEQLVRNCRSHPNVECFQLALGDRSELRNFYVNEFSTSSSILPLQSVHMEEFPHARNTHVEEMRTTSLQQVFSEKKLLSPDFIKIDVQGAEDRIIRGGKEIFRKARFCMFELSLVSLYEGSLLMVEMNALLREMGFKLVSILEKKVVGQSGEILQLDGVFENRNST